MNDFLAKHGYFLEQQGKQVIIHHKPESYGCIHIVFVTFLIPNLFLIYFVPGFALALIPLAFFYFMEVDKRKKHANNVVLDLASKRVIIHKRKKIVEAHRFSDVTSVISTSEHIGGYASSDRNTTEEYRREVNVVFGTADIITLFSIVSDYEDQETEIDQLIKWLEKIFDITI